MANYHELRGSRDLVVNRTSATSEWRYMVRQAADEDEAYELIADMSPDSYQPSTISAPLQRDKIEVEDLGAGVFSVVVSYTTNKPTENEQAGTTPDQTTEGGSPAEGQGNTMGDTNPDVTLGRNWSYSISPQTTRITNGLSLISATAPAGQTAPDYGTMINASPEGIGGTDIFIPEGSINISETVPNMTVGRFIKLCWLACKMNFAAWAGFGPRELLYMGSQIAEADANGKRKLNHELKYSPTYKNIVVSSDITVPIKRGWDYLWILYGQVKDSGSNLTIQKPIAAYVVKVYPEININDEIGIQQ